jgi:DNA-binding NtrC family response regulator
MASPSAVLLVDDDPVTCHALPDMLMHRLRNVAVTACESASIALERLRHTRYHAVITDASMPDMDGITLLRHIHELHKHIPVVMVSGWIEPGLARRALQAGAFAFVPKPIQRTALLSAVWLAIQCSGLHERVEREERRLVRLSALLRQTSTRTLQATAVFCDAQQRMDRAMDSSIASVEKIERVMARLIHYHRVYREELFILYEEARGQARQRLQTLDE